MSEQSSILEGIIACPMKLFWFTGILESRRIIGQDILESMIFESLTLLKQVSKLFIYVCGEEFSVFVTSVLLAVNFIRICNSCAGEF